MSSLFEAAAAFEEAAAHGANPVILERSGKGHTPVVSRVQTSGGDIVCSPNSINAGHYDRHERCEFPCSDIG